MCNNIIHINWLKRNDEISESIKSFINNLFQNTKYFETFAKF